MENKDHPGSASQQTTDPITKESIQRGEDAIRIQKQISGKSKEEADAEEKKDAEKWRNEG